MRLYGTKAVCNLTMSVMSNFRGTVWLQASLELDDVGNVNIQGNSKQAQCRRQKRYNTYNKAVKVGVWALNVQGADVINGKHNGHIYVVKKSMRRQKAVVRLDDGSGNLGERIDAETKHGLLAVVNSAMFV